jgi:N-acetylglucosaminyl-diphospho-decaprenol L-rhamnosyltransferase
VSELTNSKPVKPVTAVIVTYQSERTIERALKGAKRGADEQLLDVVIVDNNSNDATREIIQREADWVRLILSEKNNGFGRGCNLGAEGVTSPYTIFINPDAVVEPAAIRTMLLFLEQHPNVGIVGPAIIEGDTSGEIELQVAGQRATPWTMLASSVPLLRLPAISWPIIPGADPIQAGWVCGAVLMIRSELLTCLQGFDPRFFLYWEEIDLCKRADEMGYQTWALGQAVAHHVGGASSSFDDSRIGGCIAKHYYQSRYYYMVKHYGRVAATIAELGEFVLLAAGSLADLARGRDAYRLRPRLQASLLTQPKRP